MMGLSKVTGHYWIGKRRPGEPINKKLNWANNRWYSGYYKYTYCKQCKQWLWSAKAICPKRTIKVPIQVTEYV